MIQYAGQTALITGASSGIGEALAHALAARGSHLILVARREDRLQALAQTLSARHGVQAHVIPADLTAPGAAQRLSEDLTRRGLTVDLLINNAGFATHGAFEGQSLGRQRDEITLNVTALVDLTHHLLPGMLDRGRGGVLNVASTAALQPDPYMAVYGATKAFVLSFSEALWAETRGRGVTVTALCPGATETPFFDVVGAQEASVGRRDTPERVAHAGLRALERGRSHVIPGAANYALGQLSRFVPRAAAALVAARLLRPRGANLTPQRAG